MCRAWAIATRSPTSAASVQADTRTISPAAASCSATLAYSFGLEQHGELKRRTAKCPNDILLSALPYATPQRSTRPDRVMASAREGDERGAGGDRTPGGMAGASFESMRNAPADFVPEPPRRAR
ncbi:hypothetical protein ebA5605 [Aromatoleum aromaticum EbN1]|uniref:Uncharacterized protein n=1 Tax=Aromatoleum aromaticum (strain DSM 19018 / LMG 30748 / EbN1) TaxID=76114 RepID=Q5P049_AROAE|nr:hypothetical protein ebA5605 [Aromatoleum aromaticum EbN1]